MAIDRAEVNGYVRRVRHGDVHVVVVLLMKQMVVILTNQLGIGAILTKQTPRCT